MEVCSQMCNMASHLINPRDSITKGIISKILPRIRSMKATY